MFPFWVQLEALYLCAFVYEERKPLRNTSHNMRKHVKKSHMRSSIERLGSMQRQLGSKVHAFQNVTCPTFFGFTQTPNSGFFVIPLRSLPEPTYVGIKPHRKS